MISDINVSDITETTATVSWATDEPATASIEYGPDANYDYSLPSTPDTATDKTSHILTISGLSPDTTYHFRVKSKGASGNEAISGEITFATVSSDENGNGTADTTAPVISDIAVSDITEATATVSWATNEATTSQVEYGETETYGSTSEEDAGLVTTHSVTLTGLSADTEYHYKVKSKDASGNEIISGDQIFTTEITTDSPSVDNTPPAISNVTEVYIMSSGVTITWDTGEAATSQVEYGETDSYGSTTTGDAGLVTAHSVTLTGLSAGTEYHYRVKSKDASGNEGISGDNSFTTMSAMSVNETLPISMFYYGEHSDAIDEAIINARPEYLVGNSMAGPREGNADIGKFSAAGIKYFEYLTGGYEEKYPKTLPVDLQSNLDYIEAVAAAGGYGIFFDEVSDGVWTPVDYDYLQQISAKAHSLGLKVVFNTGVNNWVDGLMDYCDYIGSTEQWANAPLTASQQRWASRLWLLRREGVEDAATAAELTVNAWDKGALSAYATSSLVTLPLWLPEYISLISLQAPDPASPPPPPEIPSGNTSAVMADEGPVLVEDNEYRSSDHNHVNDSTRTFCRAGNLCYSYDNRFPEPACF